MKSLILAVAMVVVTGCEAADVPALDDDAGVAEQQDEIISGCCAWDYYVCELPNGLPHLCRWCACPSLYGECLCDWP